MPSTSIQKSYRLYSRFSLKVKELIFGGLSPGRIDCCKINRDSSGNAGRISIINNAAPDCVCEKHSMSHYSPHPINDEERITRFVFFENHLRNDKKSIKPNFFSHIETKGCSIQRETIVDDEELVAFVKRFREKNPTRNWLGVVTGDCHEIRRILTDQDKRTLCVYDTGHKLNPAHGEICKTQHIEEADKVELRRRLMKVFHNGIVITPDKYRDGRIFSRTDAVSGD